MSYKKNCNRCNQQILMDESMGKWRALNIDGTVHICQEQRQPQPQQKQVQEHKSQLTLEELDARLKKVERIVLGTN